MKSCLSISYVLRNAFCFAASLIFVTALFLNAYGQTTTFAQFLGNPAGQHYVFTNGGGSGNFNTIVNGAPVFFFYSNIAGLPAALQGPQTAHVFVTTTTTQSGTTGGPGNPLSQPFNSQITIQILRDTPAPPGVGGGSRTNLLTAVITPSAGTPALTGTDGGTSATLSASTPSHNVVFTSHFLLFGATVSRDLALSFTSVQPNLTLNGNGFLNGMTAAGTGTFASNPPPTYGIPLAGDVSVGGRVLGPNGRALGNAEVTLLEEGGQVRIARTSSFGYFRFDDVTVGQTVLVAVRSKRYTYSPQLISLGDNALDIVFTPGQ